MIYLIIRTGSIVNFFSDYIHSSYYTNITNIAGTYVNYFMYGAIILILIANIFIYFLMKSKKKSKRFYFFSIIFYVILFVLIGIVHSILSGMEINTIEAATARAYRDFAYIFYIPQFFFAAFILFRGVGFDIKKFNFETDLKELEISDIDAEEFELNLGIDEYKWKRNIRRFIRELKYYIKENKFIFTILCTIVTIFLGTIIYLNVSVYNKTYKQKQILSHNNLNVQVLGSMVTNRDYSGKNLKDNKYYLVLQAMITNKSNDSKTLDYNSFFIELKNRRVYPTLDQASYFLDYGMAIRQDTELKTNDGKTYILAYELNEDEITTEYTLKILEQVSLKVGEITPDYKKVSLKPYQAIALKEEKELEMGKILTFENSNIGYSTFQVTNYQIKDSYTYQYQYCISTSNCRAISDKIATNSAFTALLVLDGNYKIDTSTNYYSAAHTDRLFPDHFFHMEYTSQEGAIKEAEVINRTPQSYSNGIILETTNELKNASNINLLITIRDKRYKIKLK